MSRIGDFIIVMGCGLRQEDHAQGVPGNEPYIAKIVAEFPWGFRVINNHRVEHDVENGHWRDLPWPS